jgi:hypothetical protein
VSVPVNCFINRRRSAGDGQVSPEFEVIARNPETSPISPILPTHDLRNSRLSEVLTFVFWRVGVPVPYHSMRFACIPLNTRIKEILRCKGVRPTGSYRDMKSVCSFELVFPVNLSVMSAIAMFFSLSAIFGEIRNKLGN